MKILKHIVSLLKRIRQGRASGKKFLPPESLSPVAMAKVMQEVEFLRDKHAVNVCELLPGEIPGTPKKADD